MIFSELWTLLDILKIASDIPSERKTFDFGHCFNIIIHVSFKYYLSLSLFNKYNNYGLLVFK